MSWNGYLNYNVNTLFQVIFSLNLNNRPDLTSKNVTIRKRNYTYVDVYWDNIVASGRTNISSIYFVTIGIKNGGMYGESVMGLVCIYHVCTILNKFYFSWPATLLQQPHFHYNVSWIPIMCKYDINL